MIQCCDARVAAESTLFDPWKFDVKISKDSVIVPKDRSGLEPVC
jgi:hypothetical protein